MSIVDDARFAMPENVEAAEHEALIETPADAADTTDSVDTTDANSTDSDEKTVTFGDLGLPDEIVRTLAKRGVTTPFPIQAATIPDALAGKDVLGRGRTGSGKTLSFGLPLLTRLTEGRTRAKRPRGLILVPTRELAMQVSDALEPYGSVLGLNLKVVCGGTSMPKQIWALERGVDILVATPGRLRDLIDRNACSLEETEIVVLDEADQMADMGFLPEVTELLDKVPAGGQRMLFSATLENEIGTLVKRYLVNPVTHEVDPSAGAVTTMTHHVLVVKPKDKAPVTNAIAARKGRTIIFVRTQMGCDRVADQLRDAGVKADALHGGMTQGARTRTLGDFKDGYVNVLVATDVAARGIHVDGIDLVLNVDPAGDHKDYLHRSGRTARAGRSGTVVTLILPHQRRSTFRLLEDAGVEATRHIVGGSFDADLVRITGARSLTEVQAESAATQAKQAERDVASLTKELERATRHAASLRDEADRLASRAANERAELGLEDEPVADATDGAEAAEGTAVAVAEARDAADAPVEVEARAPRADRGFSSREERGRDDRGDRGGFQRRDDRGGFRRDDRRDDRGGFQRRDDRGGERGGFQRRDDREGFRRDDRRDDRGGFQRRDDRGGERGGFQRRDDREGFRRDDRRDDRGDRGGDRGGERGGFQRREDRPSYGAGRSFGGDRDRRPSFGARRDDHRPASGNFRRDDRRDDRGGFQRRDDRGSSGFRAGGSADRKPRWKN
ncbi:DEAD/DEAH box helicase [Streptacidiphilus fuscans]|uniref:DEAD/DEAH box helicase n=1 Tax=Streptacidiphilus fuscans TaxID=2789292 RepID=A0A931B5S8_9ACTN|nr:DEAD/DEAH box helicase [Streptacidiphilus fuscans]MBF9068393.1 DEAD/DEAH box helicase [Streptacidiphilus fuscans]